MQANINSIAIIILGTTLIMGSIAVKGALKCLSDRIDFNNKYALDEYAEAYSERRKCANTVLNILDRVDVLETKVENPFLPPIKGDEF